MLEYVSQTIFLFSVLFVYMLCGSVFYSAVGEGYKATPLRCFAVGVGLWILLVILSTVLFSAKLEHLWWLFVAGTLGALFFLPKKDQEETLQKEFFLQVLTSFAILLPAFVFLGNDKLHLWQEFAIYGKGVFTLLEQNYITSEFLTAPISYQLAILPVGYFTELQDSIFACFNFAVIAFVACEFVRNSGVRIALGNILFPLVVAFALLVVLNPFKVTDFILSADPFIFVCAIGFAFAEYIFRRGHLPKNVAALAPAIILMLLAFSSTQGFLLGCSLFLVLSLRYLIQFQSLNVKQYLGYLVIPSVSIFVVLLWQYFLNEKGLGFLVFDTSKVTTENIQLFYKAIFFLAKQNVSEVIYILAIFAFGVYSLTRAKNLDDVVVDKYVVRSVFWIILFYVFICVPIFFSQYEYVARASYSLGFTTIALIQFIILMPLGRLIKEGLDIADISVSASVKLTLVAALVVVFVMNKSLLDRKQNPRVEKMQEIAQYMQNNLEKDSDILLIDIKKTGKLYQYILDYKNTKDFDFEFYDVAKMEKGVENNHKILSDKGFEYVLLHAPNNLLIKSFEHNLDPKFSYLYKIEKGGFYLVKKFEHKLYKDTNYKF